MNDRLIFSKLSVNLGFLVLTPATLFTTYVASTSADANTELCELFLVCAALNLQFIPFQHIIIQRDCYLLGISDFLPILKIAPTNLSSIYCERFVNHQYILLMPVMLHVFAKTNEARNERDTHKELHSYTVERGCTTFN